MSTSVLLSAQDNCLQTNSESGLPFFQGYTGAAGRPARRIQHQHQAIIPSYKLNCCGNITEWGVDLNPEEDEVSFSFNLQVWRPSPTVNTTGCYSLVDNFMITSTSIATEPRSDHVARVTPDSRQDQLQFQPGDVLGFYVESHGSNTPQDNGVVLLNNANHDSELVWYGRINTISQNSQTNSCPYPVGASRVLSSLTQAAPVISIATITYPCPQTSLTLVPRVTSTPQPYPTYYNTPSPHSTVTTFTSSDRLSQQTPTVPGSISDSVNVSLIAGAVTTILVVCILTLIIIIAFVAMVKKCRTVEKALDTTHNDMTFSNQVYGKSASYTAKSKLLV